MTLVKALTLIGEGTTQYVVKTTTNTIYCSRLERLTYGDKVAAYRHLTIHFQDDGSELTCLCRRFVTSIQGTADITISRSDIQNDRLADFDQLWDLLERKDKDMPVSTAPYKAVLVRRKDPASMYDGDVFLYSSQGLRRMTFTEFLDIVMDKHDAKYRLEKCDPAFITSPLVHTSLEKLRAMNMNGVKKDTAYRCYFRDVWYDLTKEVIEL